MQQDENANDKNEEHEYPSIDEIRYKKDSVEKNENGNDDNVRNPGIFFHTTGIISIIFGVIVAVYTLITLLAPPKSFISLNEEGFTLFEIVMIVAVLLVFAVPGVICIGVARIINIVDE